MNRYHFRVLAAVACVAVLAAALALWHSLAAVAPAQNLDQALLPGLADRLADVAAIEVSAGDATITVKRVNNTWILPGKDDYPAAPGKVEALLSQLAGIKLIEEKTADPARYEALGLGGAKAREIRLLTTAGGALGDVVFGNPDFSMGRLGGGTYVRRMGEARTYLAEGMAAIPATPVAFTAGTVFALQDPQKIAGATMSEKGETLFSVTRAKDGKDVTLAPAKGTPDPAKLVQFLAMPAMLSFEDMRRAPEHGKPARIATFMATGGGKYTLALFPEGKDLWVEPSESGTGETLAAGYLYRLPAYRAGLLMQAPGAFYPAKEEAKEPAQESAKERAKP